MDKKWIATKKKFIGILLNNWANPQYKVIILYIIYLKFRKKN